MKYLAQIVSTFVLFLSCLSVSSQNARQLSDLPTVYIETEAPVTSKEDYVKATLRYVDTKGETYYDALGIRGRGNSTWALAKKPYRIKFDKKQEFLGPERAKAKSWTLIANYADKSLMRNALAAYVGELAGQPFTAAAEFVDLVLNGKYVGNYQISDQVEVRAKRVDIVEQDEPMTDTSNITGGYLLEVDGFAYYEPCYFMTSRGIVITVKSPDDEIIDKRQTNYIRSYIQKFEDALFSADFTDPDNGYRKYVDENTLISWYVASEMTTNPDAFWSTYIYKNQDDPKIYWGPMWDYDIAFNNCNRKGDMTRRMIREDGFGKDLTGVWVRRMWEDPWFVNAVNEKWKSMIGDGLEDNLLKFIDDKEAELTQSQCLDGELWPVDQRVHDEYCLFSTYSATVDFLRRFVSERIDFLTETFEKEAEGVVPTSTFELEENYYYRIHNANTMKCADLTGDGAAVCGNTYVLDTESQQWIIKSTDDGYYTIINRETEQAVTDASPIVYGSYQCGAQLTVTDEEEDNYRQQWQFAPLPTGGSYVIVNRATGLSWNNSGGGGQDGNPFIAWYNDSDNPNKPNRQWRIIRDELKDDEEEPVVDGISNISGKTDYIVTYSPSGSMIRFIVGDNSMLEGSYTIVNLGGMTVMSGAIVSDLDVSSLSAGAYVLVWETDGQRTSRKFIKQ